MQKIINLKYPFEVEIDGVVKEVSEVKLKRLKVRDLKSLSKDSFDSLTKGIGITQVVPILALMNNMKDEHLDQLDISDILVILEDIGNFF
jgi:hypothetical protein